MSESAATNTNQEQDLIYALDIGTRSVIGILAKPDGDKVKILAIEKQPHQRRTMMDGQIEDIEQVAHVVSLVTRNLEQRMQCSLSHACVAAAGRALRTEQGEGKLELSTAQVISADIVAQVEAQAVSQAEEKLQTSHELEQRLFLVGYTTVHTTLDNYKMTHLEGHTGSAVECSVVATFLPSEVIDSLYSVMRKAGLDVSSLTLEPIAALNAAIPADLRLLNLGLVDIGAGTSDIAICRDGSVVGYTMATVAGDEITEAIMKECLVDYTTAEEIKFALSQEEAIHFVDILGLEQTVSPEELSRRLSQHTKGLAEEIAQCITTLNGGAPSAVFLAGGGSKLANIQTQVAEALGMEQRRVAVAGGHFKNSAYSDTHELEDPEYTTPLGIAISAGLGLIGDSYRVTLNDQPARLFRSGRLTALELLMMNGFTYSDLLGRSGKTLVFYLDGKRQVFHPEPATPARLGINGKEALPSSLIHAGDQIIFIPAQSGGDRTITVGELLKKYPKASGFMMGDRKLSSEENILTDWHIQSINKASTLPTPPKAAQLPTEQGDKCRFILNGKPIELSPKEDKAPYFLMDLLEHTGIDFREIKGPVTLEVNGRESAFRQVLANGDVVTIANYPQSQAK